MKENFWRRCYASDEFKKSPNYREAIDEKMRDIAEARNTLWHYTNFEALFKIIQNRSLRFTRIDCVNDLLEKESLCRNDLYLRTYVACFNNSSCESIPLWSIYTTKGKGVRIEFKFSRNKIHYCIGSLAEYNESIEAKKAHFLKRITDVAYMDESVHDPIIEINRNEETDILFDEIAYIKGTAWEYEKETRIIVVSRDNLGEETPRYLDFLIDFSELKSICITFDPWMEVATKEKIEMDVRELLKEFEPLVSFRDSALTGKIR